MNRQNTPSSLLFPLLIVCSSSDDFRIALETPLLTNFSLESLCWLALAVDSRKRKRVKNGGIAPHFSSSVTSESCSAGSAKMTITIVCYVWLIYEFDKEHRLQCSFTSPHWTERKDLSWSRWLDYLETKPGKKGLRLQFRQKVLTRMKNLRRQMLVPVKCCGL